jgi:hypothetical protein
VNEVYWLYQDKDDEEYSGSLAGVKSAVILVISSQVIVTSGNVFEAYIPVTFTDNQPNPPDFPCYPISL